MDKKPIKVSTAGKRLLIFFAIFFIPAIFITYFLFLWLNNAFLVGFILVLVMLLFFLLFSFVCAKIDKKRENKFKQNSKRDPFKD